MVWAFPQQKPESRLRQYASSAGRRLGEVPSGLAVHEDRKFPVARRKILTRCWDAKSRSGYVDCIMCVLEFSADCMAEAGDGVSTRGIEYAPECNPGP